MAALSMAVVVVVVVVVAAAELIAGGVGAGMLTGARAERACMNITRHPQRMSHICQGC